MAMGALVLAVHVATSWGHLVGGVELAPVGPVIVGREVAFAVTRGEPNSSAPSACEVRVLDSESGRVVRAARVTVAQPRGTRSVPPAGVRCRDLAVRGGELWVLVEDHHGVDGDVLHARDDGGRAASFRATPSGAVVVALSGSGVGFLAVSEDTDAVDFHPARETGWAAVLLRAETTEARRSCAKAASFDIAVARCEAAGCGAPRVIDRVCTEGTMMELAVLSLASGGALVSAGAGGRLWVVDAAGDLLWKQDTHDAWMSIAGEIEDGVLATCALDIRLEGKGTSWREIDLRDGALRATHRMDSTVKAEETAQLPACVVDRSARAVRGVLHDKHGVRLFRAPRDGPMRRGPSWVARSLPPMLHVERDGRGVWKEQQDPWRAPGHASGLALAADGAPLVLLSVSRPLDLAPLLEGAHPEVTPHLESHALIVRPEPAADAR